jgi:hypothetical protein
MSMTNCPLGKTGLDPCMACSDYFKCYPGNISGVNIVPNLTDLRGIAPNATGEMSSEEFVRNLRDGNEKYKQVLAEAYEVLLNLEWIDECPYSALLRNIEGVLGIKEAERG